MLAMIVFWEICRFCKSVYAKPCSRSFSLVSVLSELGLKFAVISLLEMPKISLVKSFVVIS